MIGQSAIFATNPLCEDPGDQKDGSVEAITVQAAIAGRKPARIMSAQIVGPMAAHMPAKDEIAMDTTPVTIMQQGRSAMPRRLSGFVRSLTRCRSHPVIFITRAKPIAEQTTTMSEALVIDLSNCLKAAIGSSASRHIAKPEVRSTKRFSQRLSSPYTVMQTTANAAHISKVMTFASLDGIHGFFILFASRRIGVF